MRIRGHFFCVKFARYLAALVLVLVCLRQAMASGPSTLYAPFWYVDDKTVAKLEITNTGLTSKYVSVTLAIKGNRQVPLAPINLAPLATVRLSLGEILGKQRLLEEESGTDDIKKQWGAGRRPKSAWGSAELKTDDASRLTAWIFMTDATESVAINTPFQSPASIWSSRLQTIWWLPSAGADAFYALQNTTKRRVKVDIELSSNGALSQSQTITLPPSEARLISLRELLSNSGNEFKNVPAIGGVELRHDGNPGDVLGRGVLVDAAVGFSTPLMIRDPTQRGGNTIHNPSAAFGTMPEKGFPATADFHPQLMLFNTSDAPVTATATVQGKKADNPVTWEAGSWQVPPKSVLKVDLEMLRLQSQAVDSGIAGINLTHTGLPSALLAEVITVDSTLTYSFYDPFFDPLAGISNTLTAISFNLEGANNTLLIQKNIMDRPARFIVRINYRTGTEFESYVLPVQTVGPQQVAVIDIKQLRDSAVPDKNGKVLPPDLTFGNAERVMEIPNSLVGSDPTYNPVTGTCGSCDVVLLVELALTDAEAFGFDLFGICNGTTDCSYYSSTCQIAPGIAAKAYYCIAAPFVCQNTPDSPVSNCIRRCLQVSDPCVYVIDDTLFAACQGALHAGCFTGCAIRCSL